MNHRLAIGRIGWAGAIAAAAVVVVLGRAPDRARPARPAVESDDEHLADLLSEFERNRAATASMQRGLGELVAATTTFLDLRLDDPVTLDSVSELIEGIHLDLPAGRASDVLDSLLEDRGLRLVTDDELNRRLLAWSVLRQQVQDYFVSLVRRHDQEIDPALRHTFPLQFVASHEHDEAGPGFEGDPLGVIEDETVRSALEGSLVAAQRARESVQRLATAEDEIVDMIRTELAGAAPAAQR